MGRWIALGLVTLAIACQGGPPFTPEPLLPSPERLTALAAERPPARGASDRSAIAIERVLPHFGSAPLTVRAYLRLERDPANVGYCLQLVNAAGMVARGTCRAVEARVWEWDFDPVPPGRYVIVLTVMRNDGRPDLRASSPPLCYSGPMFSCGEDG